MATVTSTDVALDDVTYRVHSTGTPGATALLFLVLVALAGDLVERWRLTSRQPEPRGPIGEAAFWKISFVCRTRGDCAFAGARLHCTGGSASDRTGGVNDLPGVAAQRRHP